MFRGFFEKTAPQNEARIDPDREQKISRAVMERVMESEENNMNKRRIFKPLLVAAAIVSVSAMSLVTANAATNGAVAEKLTELFTVFVNGEPMEVEVNVSEYDEGDVHVKEYSFDVPDDNGISVTEKFICEIDGSGEPSAFVVGTEDTSECEPCGSVQIPIPDDAGTNSTTVA